MTAVDEIIIAYQNRDNDGYPYGKSKRNSCHIDLLGLLIDFLHQCQSDVVVNVTNLHNTLIEDEETPESLIRLYCQSIPDYLLNEIVNKSEIYDFIDTFCLDAFDTYSRTNNLVDETFMNVISDYIVEPKYEIIKSNMIILKQSYKSISDPDLHSRFEDYVKTFNKHLCMLVKIADNEDTNEKHIDIFGVLEKFKTCLRDYESPNAEEKEEKETIQIPDQFVEVMATWATELIGQGYIPIGTVADKLAKRKRTIEQYNNKDSDDVPNKISRTEQQDDETSDNEL